MRNSSLSLTSTRTCYEVPTPTYSFATKPRDTLRIARTQLPNTGTEGAAVAAMKACKELVESFKPIRDALKRKPRRKLKKRVRTARK